MGHIGRRIWEESSAQMGENQSLSLRTAQKRWAGQRGGQEEKTSTQFHAKKSRERIGVSRPAEEAFCTTGAFTQVAQKLQRRKTLSQILAKKRKETTRFMERLVHGAPKHAKGHQKGWWLRGTGGEGSKWCVA